MIEQLLQTHWRLQPPFQIEQVTTGLNNQTHLVRCSDGNIFFLKHYQNVDAGSRVGFEHKLLQELSQSNLPFAVPAPVSTVTGEAIARVPDGGAQSLTRRISGRPGWRGDPALALGAGHALALLDIAMAQMEFDTIIEIPSTFGALVSGHPAIPDLARATHAAFHDLEMATAIDATLASAERRWRISTAGWPTQIIHADYFPPNVLVTDGEVSGVIDFEFAGTSHRAMDFAIGLVAFGAPHKEFVPMWEGMEAFATGYLPTNPISDEERATMPDLILMREASSFVHWLGRMNQGLVSRDELRRRGRRLLDVDDWLDTNGRDLVARLARVEVSL